MSDWPELHGPVEDVAPRLLGAVLRKGPVAVRITEVEAYAGDTDPGSHAYRGRTPRTAVMFGPAGRLYCYLSYGIHVCANVVVGEEGTASAVLVRAGHPIAGGGNATGPGRLCRALGIALDDNGTDLTVGPTVLELGSPVATYEVGPRTGLRLAPDRPWRFWVAGERSVSPYRRHPRATSEQPDL